MRWDEYFDLPRGWAALVSVRTPFSYWGAWDWDTSDGFHLCTPVIELSVWKVLL